MFESSFRVTGIDCQDCVRDVTAEIRLLPEVGQVAFDWRVSPPRMRVQTVGRIVSHEAIASVLSGMANHGDYGLLEDR